MPNPEFRRNIWLDFTFHRMLMAPIVVLLLVYLFYLTRHAKGAADISFTLACLFIFLWGTKRASDSVIEEVNNNTWDFQRQSAISPWQMAWGKLFGSTAFSWYGAIICFLFYSFYQSKQAPLFIFGLSASTLSVSHEILLLMITGLFTQAFAMLLSLQKLSLARREKNNRSFKYFIFALFIGLILAKTSFFHATLTGHTITWHNHLFNIGAFSFTSLILFLGWAILGLQRSFCKELQYPHIPWAWLLFNLYCMIYFSGFVSFEPPPIDFLLAYAKEVQNQMQNASSYIAFFVAQALTYFALFIDDITFIRYKYFLARVHERNVLESLQQLPWWPISLVLSILAGFMVIVHQQGSTEYFSPAILMLTSTLFLIRDIALIHFFNFGKNPRKAFGACALYLFILYFLLPLILNALHLDLTPLLIPSWGKSTFLAIISSMAQIVFISALCLKRWKLNLTSIAVQKTQS
ncbi:MAG: hypothetical protein JSS07_10105 [Proteobacteria bacterium]|nr:hypothetical protein [Pseudomonadota bacterium]